MARNDLGGAHCACAGQRTGGVATGGERAARNNLPVHGERGIDAAAGGAVERGVMGGEAAHHEPRGGERTRSRVGGVQAMAVGGTRAVKRAGGLQNRARSTSRGRVAQHAAGRAARRARTQAARREQGRGGSRRREGNNQDGKGRGCGRAARGRRETSTRGAKVGRQRLTSEWSRCSGSVKTGRLGVSTEPRWEAGTQNKGRGVQTRQRCR